MVLSMMQLSLHRFLRDIYYIQFEEPREPTYSLTSSNRQTYLIRETKENTAAYRYLIEPLTVLRLTSLHAHISHHISWTPQRRFQNQQYSQEQVSMERYYIETMHASPKFIYNSAPYINSYYLLVPPYAIPKARVIHISILTAQSVQIKTEAMLLTFAINRRLDRPRAVVVLVCSKAAEAVRAGAPATAGHRHRRSCIRCRRCRKIQSRVWRSVFRLRMCPWCCWLGGREL